MAVRLQWHDDLDAVAADAGGALDRAAQPRLYDRLDWFRMTVAHGLSGPPVVLRARDGEASAWLFLAPAGRRHAAPLASWYTLAFAPVLAGEDAARLLPALFREAARRFDVLTLEPVLSADGGPLREALATAGWRTMARITSANRSEIVAGGFARWWLARPSRLRNTVARRRRSHPVDVAIHDRFDAEAWEAYSDVYRASWKPEEGSMPFLRELAERGGAAGTLRLGVARDSNGRAVAAQLWLVEGGTAIIHKLAHREDAAAGSPGSNLSAAMFAHVIDRDAVTRLDFGLGDEPYKADWLADVAPVWRIDAYRPFSARGAAGLGRSALGRLARRLRAR
ncbi:GNAT family N-acetyltransferase [Sphingomonas sp.]|uniref:GNAT family N-acetyltransferase n=1 Tax=Sphingomonas sp. TaxID=28214 RepID=UPI003B00B7C7